MSQQLTWRCGACEAVVTASSEECRQSLTCSFCGTAKPAPKLASIDEDGLDAYDARAGSSFAEMTGPELDRLLARRVLGEGWASPVPPYSSEDWAATALAELVGRHSRWSFHLAFCGNAWMASFTERGDAKNDVSNRPLASLVSATGRTRAHAISRALLKVARSPRWLPLGRTFLGDQAARANSETPGVVIGSAQPKRAVT
jgi:hypothetical protein